MAKYYLIFICLWFAHASHAQVVYGAIKSHENAAPIPFATLEVLNTNLHALADSLGEYRIKILPGNYQLNVRALGYASELVELSVSETDEQLDISLTPIAFAIDEIVVSANKTEESLFQTPISLTYLSAEKIESTRTWELQDLRAIVPNYQYADFGVSYQQLQSIRGISVFSDNPSIATYIDGVNSLDVSSNGIQLMDVASIEVLRGPQGTLYGRNAMGGVINITTKKPTFKTNGFINASIGNQGLQRYGFGIKTPIIKDRLLLGFSGQFEGQHGFYTNDLTNKTDFDGNLLAGIPEDGKRMGDEKSFYGNLFLKWLPKNEQWDILLNIKGQKDESDNSLYYQAVENEVVAVKKPFKMAVNSLGVSQRILFNNSVSARYRHAKFHFSTVTAYQYVGQMYDHIDQDLLPYDVGTGSTFKQKEGDFTPQQVFSQEISFSSPMANQLIKWKMGGYFFHQDYDKTFSSNYGRLALFFGETPGLQVSQSFLTNLGAAGFGQVSYALNRQWELTLGLRYDYENRSNRIARFLVDSLGNRNYVLPEYERSADFQAVSPKVAFSYQLNSSHHFHLLYSRGFRAGGINGSSKVSGEYENYLPEFSNNMELGYKFNSSSNKYYLQASFFYLNWKDLQLDFRTEEGNYIIENIGNVNAFGLEIEGSAKPIKNLLLDGSFGYNHSRYADFLFLNENIKGNKTILSPDFTLFLGAQYGIELPKQLTLTIRGEGRLMGKQYFDLANTISQPFYAVFNSQMDLSYKKMKLTCWLRNALNQQSIAYAMPGYFRYTILNRPRSFGLSLGLNF